MMRVGSHISSDRAVAIHVRGGFPVNRRVLLFPTALLAAAALAACGSGTPATQAPGTGTTVTPGAPTAAVATPPAAATPLPPGVTPGAVVPDPQLEAHFPTAMGGEPCKNQSYTLSSYEALSAGLVALFQPLLSATGVNANDVSLGNGSCSGVLNDSSFSVSYDGLRLRSGDIAKLAQALPNFQAQANSDQPPTVTPATMGGRSGALVADADGSSTHFLWIIGDSLFQYSIENEPAVDNFVVQSFR
jgi:hypothetical protein